MNLATRILNALHRIVQRIDAKEKPLELVAPVCLCGEPITDPASALTFEGELFHDVQCVLMIPTILRQPKRLQAAVKGGVANG